MGTQTACLARWECVPQSPTSRACTACAAPAPVGRPPPLPDAPVCCSLLVLVLRTRASRAGCFDAWLYVLFVLFWLLAWFFSHRAALIRCPCLSLSLLYFLRCTICLSVRLFLRVFLPSVGKAQGVCG